MIRCWLCVADERGGDYSVGHMAIHVLYPTLIKNHFLANTRAMADTVTVSDHSSLAIPVYHICPE